MCSAKQLSSGADTVFDSESNSSFTTSLWLLDTQSLLACAPGTGVAPSLPPPRRLTYVKGKSDSEPLWMDDTTVAFVSNRSGKAQIWAISVLGGEAEQLSDYPLSIGNLRYNRQLGYFVFSCEVYPDISALGSTAPAGGNNNSSSSSSSAAIGHKGGVAVMEATVQRDETKNRSKAQYTKYTKLYVRRWDKWIDQKRSHLFLQVVTRFDASKTGTLISYRLDRSFLLQDLMPGLDADCPLPPFGGEEQFAITKEGDEIAYSTMIIADSSVAWSTNANIYTIKLQRVPSEENKSTDAGIYLCILLTQCPLMLFCFLFYLNLLLLLWWCSTPAAFYCRSCGMPHNCEQRKRS
jgi:hypothetical protein